MRVGKSDEALDLDNSDLCEQTGVNVDILL